MIRRFTSLQFILVCLLVVGGIMGGGVWHLVKAQNVELVRYEYHLRNGWNLISFPQIPITVTTASELMDYVEQQGGYVLMVSRWNGDRWQEYATVGKSRYGEDFQLKRGEAYFVSNAQDMTIQIAQKPSSMQKEITLQQGWNLIALSPDRFKDARAVLDQANQKKTETVSEIDRWKSGNWQALVKRWYSPTNVQEYGDNFAIESVVGYMIKAKAEVRLP